METVYDWVTMAIFAGLVVLFLQRSMSDERQDSMIPYMAGAAMCVRWPIISATAATICWRAC